MRHARLIATIALLASASSVFAAGKSGPASGANAKDEKSLVSVSGMTAFDAAACVAELTSRKVVFEQAGDVTQQGCKLSGAIKLKAVTTAFGTVGISGEPTMLCGFVGQFSGWVRDVAAPLTLGYTGQRLARIETGPGFMCKARYDKPGEIPSEHAKGDALDVASFLLADGRRILVKATGFRSSPDARPDLRFANDGLRLFHHGPRSRRAGPRGPFPLRHRPARRHAELPHLRVGEIKSYRRWNDPPERMRSETDR